MHLHPVWLHYGYSFHHNKHQIQREIKSTKLATYVTFDLLMATTKIIQMRCMGLIFAILMSDLTCTPETKTKRE